MKTVRQLIDTKNAEVPMVLSTTPDTTVFEALTLMKEHDVGALVVLDGDRLAGILSERDYARKVVLSGRTSRETFVREIMTERVLCVRPEQSVEQCMALMTDKHVRHLPVLEDERVIGVIAMRDVVKEVISEQQFVIAQLENYIRG